MVAGPRRSRTSLGLNMKILLTSRFEQNRKHWLLVSGVLFIAIGVLPFDTHIIYKVGYICLFTAWGDFLARPGDGGLLPVLAVTGIWILVSGLLGWLAAALVCLVRAGCATGANAQPGPPPNGGPAPRSGNSGAAEGPPSVS